MRATLIVLELFTGVTALVGGLLFAVQPDGALLGADVTLLDGTPFVSWLVPGLLLMLVVGVGFLAAALWQWRRGPGASFISVVAGVGLILFEVVEFTLIGFHPLQPLYALVGVAVMVLALRVAGSERAVSGGSAARPG